MADGISLIIIKGEQGYDVTQLVETIKWKGRKGSAARSINVTLVDDDGYQHARSEIDIEKGHQCLFSYNGKELFRGNYYVADADQHEKAKIHGLRQWNIPCK